VEQNTRDLRKVLRRAGLSDVAIEAAWPTWWSEEAGSSRSAQAELRFALARNLGLAPKPLIGDRVEFVWRDHARFKHLRNESTRQKAALNSFGRAVSRLILLAAAPGSGLAGLGAPQLRGWLLRDRPFVDLASLLALCWAAGVPVVHLRVFPLASKGMHAMVVRIEDRYAVLLGRDAQYPAPVAFTLAHEVGHIGLGHLSHSDALVDMRDPAESHDADDEEAAADRFGLELLTGSPDPDIRTNIDNPSARALARSVLDVGPARRIEPGSLALCVAFRTGQWATALAAMPYIYGGDGRPVWQAVNRLASDQLDLTKLSSESADYLTQVLKLEDV
jgi:hypothetical protein